eukprot:Skav207141  [mRNA]  locus=scaffold2681:127078:128673:- [translate_table: standard]
MSFLPARPPRTRRSPLFQLRKQRGDRRRQSFSSGLAVLPSQASYGKFGGAWHDQLGDPQLFGGAKHYQTLAEAT